MTQVAEDPLIGHTLAGKYVIERLVREEGLGKVYDAVVLPERSLVSVKVLHPHLVEDKEAFGRFGREMLATAAVNHPNSVRMHDFGEHRGIFHFIVLERLWSTTLRMEIAREGQLSIDRTCHIAGQIASVLGVAHGEHIVHRNLTSDNVLLLDNAQTDYVKVRDFGSSRIIDERGDSDDDISGVQTRVGGATYMAPEYIDQGLVDPRGDLYALGVLMYEMLAGQPPFTGRPGDVLEAHVRETPLPVSTHAAVPLWLDALVSTLLEKDPVMRPRSAGEVLTALQRGTGKRLQPPDLTPEPVRRTQIPIERRDGDAGRGKALGVLSVIGVVFAVVLLVGAVAALLGGYIF